MEHEIAMKLIDAGLGMLFLIMFFSGVAVLLFIIAKLTKL
jgi:hypothetical protein